MKKNWLAIFLCILSILALSTSVLADDDDDDHEKYEYYQKSEDQDNDNNEQKWNAVTETPVTTDYWNIWSREAWNNPNKSLPISEAQEVSVMIGDKETSLYFIPQEGQLLVSANAIATAFDAKATWYPQSKICTLKKANHELIVRAGSNAVFEDKVRTPMPTIAVAYEKSVYLPVSVAANALGYRVLWNETKQAIIFQAI